MRNIHEKVGVLYSESYVSKPNDSGVVPSAGEFVRRHRVKSLVNSF